MAVLKVFHTDKIDGTSIQETALAADDFVKYLAAQQAVDPAQMDTAMSDNGFTITIMSGLSDSDFGGPQ
jgi:hypothetical protein